MDPARTSMGKVEKIAQETPLTVAKKLNKPAKKRLTGKLSAQVTRHSCVFRMRAE